jgi:DNA-binding transcriptional MocR family regulator
MTAALRLSRRSDRAVADSASQHGVQVLPLSRYAFRSRAWRGLLLGFSALDEASIGEGVLRLGRAIAGRRSV